jgi:hypothetical protein
MCLLIGIRRARKRLWRAFIPTDIVLALLLKKSNAFQDVGNIIDASFLDTQFNRSSIEIECVPRRSSEERDKLFGEQSER